MAIGIITLSKNGRWLLAIIVGAINIFQILIGVSLFSLGVYVVRTVGPRLYSEKAEINFVFTIIAMYGINVMLQYTIGLKMCHKCLTKSHKKSTSTILVIWIVAACNTIVNGIIIAALAVKTSKHIVRSMRHSLRRGISRYLTDMTWKHTIDKLQQFCECCGITGIEDWRTVPWVLLDYIDLSNERLKNFKKTDTGIYLQAIPWSCCKINYELPCFHDDLQQMESQSVFNNDPKIVEESLYSVGCLEILRQPIENGLIVVILADITLLLLQVSEGDKHNHFPDIVYRS